MVTLHNQMRESQRFVPQLTWTPTSFLVILFVVNSRSSATCKSTRAVDGKTRLAVTRPCSGKSPKCVLSRDETSMLADGFFDFTTFIFQESGRFSPEICHRSHQTGK